MTRYTDIASLILVPVALVAALVAGAADVVDGVHREDVRKGTLVKARCGGER